MQGVDPECEGLSPREVAKMVAAYTAIQCGIRLLAPATISDVYLPAVVNHMRTNCLEAAGVFHAATKDQDVKMILRGFVRFHREHNPRSGNVKVPFGIDLAVKSKGCYELGDEMYYGEQDPIRRRVYEERMFLTMMMGICFLLRCSEHIKSKEGTLVKPVRRDQLTFFDQDCNRIPYRKVGVVKATQVTINIPFSKADQLGLGRKVSHSRQENRRSICILCLLEDWIKVTRDSYGAQATTPLYEVSGFRPLKLDHLTTLMHRTVVEGSEVDPDKVKATSHSLRY